MMIAGRHTGLMAMALALASVPGGNTAMVGKYDVLKNKPDARGRRKEKDDAKIAKAEAKRRRKAEKRMAPNASHERPACGDGTE